MPTHPATGTSYPKGTTIGVELFDRSRRVLERDLEPIVHDGLTRALLDYQGLELRPVDEADLILRGSVVDYRRRGGVRSETFQLLETGVHLKLDAELVDRRSGIVLSRATPRTWSSYALDGVPREAAARERGFDFLARKLLFELFSEAGHRRVEHSADELPDPMDVRRAHEHSHEEHEDGED